MTTTDHIHPFLRLGSKGGAVKELQYILKITEDGIFGPETLKAVRFFQEMSGLKVDGYVGPYTWDALHRLEESRTVFTPEIFESIVHPDRIGGKITPLGIVWHFTAMQESTEVALLRNWKEGRGRGNAATYLVRRNGQIVQLTPFDSNSNHAGGGTTGRIYFTERGEHPSDGKGRHPNSSCIGVELSSPGRVTKDLLGWKIAYTGAERIPVEETTIKTDAELGLPGKREDWGWCDFTDKQRTSAKRIIQLARERGMVNEPITIRRQKVDGKDYGMVDCYSMEINHSDLDPSRRSDAGPLWNAAALTEV